MYWKYLLKNMPYENKTNVIFGGNNEPKQTLEKREKNNFQHGISGHIS